ncbi:TPA: D-lactate dehydrogenase VanH-A, partial [Salmonella enterica]|nr:D-lactate dehydrogenase VanH-A [Salmonella enterica]
MNNIGITVYGCEQDEADAFHALSPRFGVMATIINANVSESNAKSAPFNQCISVGHKSEISASILLALKRAGVKYISTRSIGCNHIDTTAAKRMGITVDNVAYSPDSVADYTMMLILMAVRNVKSIVRSVEKHDFRLDSDRGKVLSDMTVGVVGTGQIGKAVIERLRGFGCKVLAYSRSRSIEVNYVPFDELLQNSDIVTLHVPLNTDTHYIISHEQIQRMKQGAFLINTGRGPLVDTYELVKALENGKLGGAALDVLEGEGEFFYSYCTQKPIDNQFLL